MTALGAITIASFLALATLRRPVAPARVPNPTRLPIETGTSRHRLVPSRLRRTASLRATPLPDALDVLSRSLRAGHSVPSALALAADQCRGPIAAQWSDVVASVESGGDLGDAVRAWGALGPGPHRSDEALAAAAISIGIAFGGPRADAIEAVAQTLRERAALGAQLRGFAAQARLSAMVISLAPLVFTSLTVAGDEASRHVMLGSAAGRVCLVIGVALDALGWWWMGRISAHAAGPIG
ncbi:MAG: type II secretion system F family protein [Acidimicrobiia bacterium]